MQIGRLRDGMIQKTTYEAPRCHLIPLHLENGLLNASAQGDGSAEDATPSDGEWD